MSGTIIYGGALDELGDLLAIVEDRTAFNDAVLKSIVEISACPVPHALAEVIPGVFLGAAASSRAHARD